MSTLTKEMLDETIGLIKALAPAEAPAECLFIRGSTGLKIIKNDMLSEDTIIVSKRLFDLILTSIQGDKNE